tara:strand:+ start:10207 stop:11172 length:966 start_codon:yes stop_codon:yes gene_type:complete
MTNILVTGGTGFLGSNLVSRLITENHQVTVFDNNFRGSFENLNKNQNLKLINGDIRNIDQIAKSLENIDVVFHLAFINGTKYFYQNPSLVMEVGIKGMINLLDSIKKFDVKKIILASSSEVYQNPKDIPTKENVECIIPDVQNPRYSYGGSKMINELLLLHHENTKLIDKIIFRPHNIYGPKMGWEHVIPELIKKIYVASNNLKNKSCAIEIQGSGRETRSFCFIDDAIDSLLILKDKGKDNEIYNIGNDYEISILKLINLIKEYLKIELSIKNINLTKGSAIRRCPDLKKIKNLGFSNKVNIEEGLKKTIDWYIKNIKYD